MYDVIIIGGGPAGLTSAVYTGRARLKTLILEANTLGGNAAMTDMIENYPGFPFGINGIDLIDNFWKQAERFGTELKMQEAVGIEETNQGIKVITGEGEYLCKAVIITVGARRRELGIPGEKEFLGRGVSYCATCDGSFFQKLTVAVVGGGDSAVKEALYLADIAAKVYLIHRREGFRANKMSVEKMLANEKVELKLNRVVKKVDGSAFVNNLLLENVVTGQEENIEVDGIFISIGLEAAAHLMGGKLEEQEGYLITKDDMSTSIPGVFAAGDIRACSGRQVATAVGDGAMAGIAVTEYLKG